MGRERLERKLTTILAADVVGYSRLMERDETDTLEALKAHRETLIDPTIAEHQGRLVKLMGDGILVEFASVVDAVNCAIAVQEGISLRNQEVPKDCRIEFRIGVHLGDIIIEGGDIYGDAVNVAARLEGLARPGGICLSRQAHDQVETKLKLPVEDLGPQKVKNIERPIRAFHLAFGPQVSTVSLTGISQKADLPEKPSIAVLPFNNLSDDADQGYFSDGITEDIITDLSKVSALFVIARNSSFSYKDRTVTTQQLSEELGVRYVVEGSVRRAGDRIRISAQLIDGKSGGHIWAERYDREFTDVFALQDEITGEIVTALRVTLTASEQEHVARRYTDNLEAYDHFLRGRDQVRATNTTNAQARELLNKSIELDPKFAAAFAILSYCYWRDWFNEWTDDPAGLSLAYEAANKAKDLDGSLPMAHAYLGWVHLWKRQYEQAETEARLAVSLDPNFAEGYARLGEILNLAGRPKEGIECIKNAMRLDPHYPAYYQIYLGHAHYAMNQPEEAITALNKSLIGGADFLSTHRTLAVILGELGRTEEAKSEVANMLKIDPDATLRSQEERMPFKDSEMLQQFSCGLRAAGLPE